MPEYQHNKDLPESVRDSLPEHGQDIYREAFNSAWKQYDEPEERRAGRDREETAHAVAWAAVKKKYRRASEGHWVPKDDGED
jgi:cation transport regulator